MTANTLIFRDQKIQIMMTQCPKFDTLRKYDNLSPVLWGQRGGQYADVGICQTRGKQLYSFQVFFS